MRGVGLLSRLQLRHCRCGWVVGVGAVERACQHTERDRERGSRQGRETQRRERGTQQGAQRRMRRRGRSIPTPFSVEIPEEFVSHTASLHAV